MEIPFLTDVALAGELYGGVRKGGRRRYKSYLGVQVRKLYCLAIWANRISKGDKAKRTVANKAGNTDSKISSPKLYSDVSLMVTSRILGFGWWFSFTHWSYALTIAYSALVTRSSLRVALNAAVPQYRQ